MGLHTMRHRIVEQVGRFRSTFIADILAGATGAVAGAPQAMGFAIVANVSPVYGLYSAVVATIAGTLTISSSFMTVAPTNALALVVGSTLVMYSGPAQTGRLFTLTLLVGVFMLLFGVLRLGSLTRFVSNAVMTGFITGAGTLVILGQLRHLTGYDGPALSRILARFWDWLTHLSQSNLHTSIIGITAIIIIYSLHHTRFKSVATLVAILFTTIFVTMVGWTDVAMVRDMSLIPSALPSPMIPDLSFAVELLPAALAIAVLGSVQSAALSQNVPQQDGSIANITRDFSGQGIANIVSSFFQGMPSGGSLSRTAVNVAAGARTRFANITAGLLVAAILLAFGPWIEQVTLAALAGHLIVAASHLINRNNISMVWNVNWTGRLSMIITYLSTLILPLEYSVYVGVLLSLGLYVYTSASIVHVSRLEPIEGGQFRETPVPDALPSGEPVIFSVTGNLYFAAVQRLEEQMPAPNGSRRSVVILRLRDNQYLGSTGIRFLERYAHQLATGGGRLLLCGVSARVYAELVRTHAVDSFGAENIFRAEDVYFVATSRALDHAQDYLSG